VSPSGRDGRLGPALLVVLLVAALAAGVLVYHARTPDLALEVPRETFDRLLGTRGEAELPAEMQFFVRFDEPHARVEIVGREDVTVRTFATDVPLAEDERIRCLWDGRDDDGDPVAPGNYRLRVVLPGQDRDMVFPLRILVRQPGGDPGSVADEDGASAVVESGCERIATGEALG
jgi:hypothetical protein